MFRSACESRGLGALVAVAVVIGGYLAVAGFMWKAYADGGEVALAAARCELVCASRAGPAGNPG